MRLLAAALLALVAPTAAAAALEVKLSVLPAVPKKGAPVTIQLRPYVPYIRPDGTCCRLEPADANYPFKVEAVSPTGHVSRIVVRRTKNRFVWAGTFRFGKVGRWTIRAPQWGPWYRTRYGKPRIRVTVR